MREARDYVAPGSTIAYASAFDADERSWLYTSDHTLVPKDRTKPYARIGFHGVRLGQGVELPIGFARQGDAYDVLPAVRDLVRFGRLNLMDAWPMKGPFDIVFCRNVVIYFDKPTQQRVLERLTAHLRPGGHLVLGHSESFSGRSLPLKQVVATVFRKV